MNRLQMEQVRLFLSQRLCKLTWSVYSFVGGGIFCMKLCDPKHTGPNYCEK